MDIDKKPYLRLWDEAEGYLKDEPGSHDISHVERVYPFASISEGLNGLIILFFCLRQSFMISEGGLRRSQKERYVMH